jgi:hypothetical protein
MNMSLSVSNRSQSLQYNFSRLKSERKQAEKARCGSKSFDLVSWRALTTVLMILMSAGRKRVGKIESMEAKTVAGLCTNREADDSWARPYGNLPSYIIAL